MTILFLLARIMTAPGRMVQMTTVRMWRLFWKRDWSLRFKGIRTLHFRIGKEHIVLMINADSILAGDHLYLYGEKVKAYLRRGARELPGVDVYPNPLVGYGAFCTFNIK